MRLSFLCVLLFTPFIFSSCGIEIHTSVPMEYQESGKITVINQTHSDNIKIDFALSAVDSGDVSSLYVRPKHQGERRFTFSTQSCYDSHSSNDCQRELRFYRNNRLSTFCYGASALNLDYRCDSSTCQPIQDYISDVICHQISPL